MRVVSLLASATETIHALGRGELLVGRSHECDYPPKVEKLPRCSDPAFAVEGGSAEIDRAVRRAAERRAADALSIYRVDANRLKELRPDLIVTQTQCEVCAVSLKDVEAVVRHDIRGGCKVLALTPARLSDVYEDIGRLGAALHAENEAKDLVTSMKARFAGLAARVRSLPKPSVVVLEWLEPLLAAGHWMPELVELAGGRDLFGPVGKRGPWLTIERLAEADPDAIVVTPCGFPMARTRRELSPLLDTTAWLKLRAVREKRVYVADGNQFFSRPGPRLVETAEALAEMLHPGEISLGREGKIWRPAA